MSKQELEAIAQAMVAKGKGYSCGRREHGHDQKTLRQH